MTKDTVCILYGSQTGNAESISKVLYEEILNKTSMTCTYDTLNNASNISFENVKYLIVTRIIIGMKLFKNAKIIIYLLIITLK